MERSLFHASPLQGLQFIRPYSHTPETPYVYACPDPDMATLFLSPYGGEMACQILRFGGIPHVVERFAGAFAERYRGRSGALYRLPASYFHRIPGLWAEELVADEVVPALAEQPIADVARHIEALADLGRVAIIHYPLKVGWLPADDSDLVDRYAAHLSGAGEDARLARRLLERHRPDLLGRVSQKLGTARE
ncbi:MAG: hypothetical protein ACM3XM_12230 [Mycobacterium leprae]